MFKKKDFKMPNIFTLNPHGHGTKFRIYREEYPKQYALIRRIQDKHGLVYCDRTNEYVWFDIKNGDDQSIVKVHGMQYTMKCGFTSCGGRHIQLSCLSQSEGTPYTDFIDERAQAAKAHLFDDDGFLNLCV